MGSSWVLVALFFVDDMDSIYQRGEDGRYLGGGEREREK